jgi:PAS domain S-box-containing protein
MAETTEKRSSGTDILIKIAKVASSTLELREILDTILEVIADGLNMDLCSICLLKPEKKIICIEAAKGATKGTVNAFCIKDEDEIVKKVFKDMQPLIVEDISSDAKIKRILNPESCHMLSLLAVPILRDDAPLGIVMVQTRDPYKCGQDEINLLKIISHNISAAIMNADLYRSVKTQLDELKVIHEIGKAITSILNIDDLLPYICREVSRIFNVRGCILRLIEGDILNTKASFGLPDEIRHDITLDIGKGPAGQVALTGNPLLINDTAEVSGDLYVPGIEATTVICVPLIFGEKTLGTLELFDKKDEWGVTAFDESDLNTLLTFASASSIAIENARRYRAETEKEKEVTQTKDYLASLINDSADAIIISDIDGMIVSWNKGAENIYGYTEDEVKGKFLPMVPSFLIDEEKNVINSIKHKETLRNLETIRQTKNGRLIEVSLTLSPITDHSGNVTGISGISRDISEKKMSRKS